MTIRMSSGLRTALMADTGMAAAMQDGYILIYSGPQPEIPDKAPTGSLLGHITTNGSPPPSLPAGFAGSLRFYADRPGSLINRGDWVISGLRAGKPGWWRFVTYDDRGGTSSKAYRIDGSVGESFDVAADMYPFMHLRIMGFTLSFP